MARTVKQKEINFLTVLQGRGGKKRLNPRSLIMPGVLLLIVLAAAGVFALLHMGTLQAQAESETIRAYLNSPDTNRQLTEAESSSAQAISAQTRAEEVAGPMENLATYPDLTSTQYAMILNYAGANITLSTMMYDRETGILSFTATSDYVLSIPTFISQLRNSGIFLDISYSGYAGNSAVTQLSGATSRTSTTTGTSTSSSSSYGGTVTPQYAFSVECSVKPPDPTPPAEAEGEANANEAEAETQGAEEVQ